MCELDPFMNCDYWGERKWLVKHGLDFAEDTPWNFDEYWTTTWMELRCPEFAGVVSQEVALLVEDLGDGEIPSDTKAAAEGPTLLNTPTFLGRVAWWICGTMEERYQRHLLWHRRGNPEATYALGICHENGVGVRHDAYTAFSLYREAADQGLSRAQHTVAVCYSKLFGRREPDGNEAGEPATLLLMTPGKGDTWLSLIHI